MFFGVDISLGTFSFFRIYFGRGFFSGFFLSNMNFKD